MNLRKAITNNKINKKGSYFVEAGITLPVFIIAAAALTLIINIVSVCENIGFTASLEIKEIDVEAYSVKVPLMTELRIESKVLEENTKINDFEVINLDYLYSDNGIDDLIAVDTRSVFHVENPIGVHGETVYYLGILSRGFTGKKESGEPLDESGFTEGDSEICYIFPKYGIRYHSENCYFVTVKYKDEDNKIKMQCEEAIRRGYTPCKVCGG